MTPLDELQAAHKRLSELRTPENWKIELRGEAWSVASEPRVWWVANGIEEKGDADLIVTLHRTIDAQLTVIDVAMSRMHVYGETTTRPEVLALARAINGETS